MNFKDSSIFEKLEILKITECEKVDIIFHARVSKCLNELKILVIKECKELKQIVEEDVENDKLSNLPSQQPQPCFPKLVLLFVEECHKLKRLISFSRCNDLPNLAVLIINRASELEELIGCEQENDYKIGEKKVQLPKLKYLMIRKLSKLCQGIESQTISYHVVVNCPKVSLTSTATFPELWEEVTHDNDLQISGIDSWELHSVFDSVALIIHESEKELIEEVASSEERDSMPKTTSTLGNSVGTVSEDNQIESESTASESSKFVESKKRKERDTTLKFVGAEITTISSPNLTDNIDETKKRANAGKKPSLVKPAIPSSGSESELRGPSPTSLTTPLHKIPLHKLVDQEQTSKPGVLEEQVSLGGTISIEDIGKERIQEGHESKETRMKTLSAGLEDIGEGSNLTNKEGRIDVISIDNIEVPPGLYTNFVDVDDAQIAINNVQLKSCPDSGINVRQTEIDLDKESAENPINFGGLCVSQLAADNLVSNTIVDLEESLKMPLKDIARSEANCIRLLTALKFLSNLSLKDAALSDGLKAIIDSMHKELPSILCSFKQAFVTSVKFAAIGAHQNEAASNLVSKISKAKDFLDAAQQKEEILNEEIIRLKKEMKDREADLSSLQEEKQKCIQETIGYKREFDENVRKDMSQMVKEQRIAQKELFEVEYKWSALCSQFQNNRLVDRNHS